jgi:putative phosphoesterase
MRLGVISDVHGNWPALQAVLEAVGPEVDGWLCAGDLAGHLPFLDEVVGAVRDLECPTVRGNHDAALLDGTDIPRSSAATQALRVQRELMSPATRAFLAALPLRIEAGAGTRRLVLFHGGPNDPLEERIAEPTDAHWAWAAGRIVIHGHAHAPRVARRGAGLFVNPGSLGLPLDGDARACCAVLDPEAGEVALQRVAYDAGPVIARLEALGFDGRYPNCLRAGRWVGATPQAA